MLLVNFEVRVYGTVSENDEDTAQKLTDQAEAGIRTVLAVFAEANPSLQVTVTEV